MRIPLFALRCILVFLSIGASLPASAQAYPNRPIRFIVPFPPGGGADVFARAVAPKLGELWGQPIVIDNRAGGRLYDWRHHPDPRHQRHPVPQGHLQPDARLDRGGDRLHLGDAGGDPSKPAGEHAC